MKKFSEGVTARRMTPADLDAVVAIDAAIVGRSRRGYFERRLQAALTDPKLHVQFAIDREGTLAGYLLARRLVGEFGRTEPAVRLEVIGVRPGDQGLGLGDALLDTLASWAAEHEVRLIRTQASWRDHGMLRFFDHSGFDLARHQVMDCEVQVASRILDREPDESRNVESSPSREIDYGTPAADHYETLARDRVDVRLLTIADAAEVARIDRHLTGRDRTTYIDLAVREAIEGSAVRVSLTARSGGLFVGFVMAKADFGDYGRTEPVAVIDILGVDPAFAHHGIGTALLSQLFVNLSALGVERVETIVSRENFNLLSFLYRVGFGPSQRLGFERRVG
ncbi:MAG: GNAT family N-acetyltransferase [Deltaproteobacteria bacterium]